MIYCWYNLFGGFYVTDKADVVSEILFSAVIYS